MWAFPHWRLIWHDGAPSAFPLSRLKSDMTISLPWRGDIHHRSARGGGFRPTTEPLGVIRTDDRVGVLEEVVHQLMCEFASTSEERFAISREARIVDDADANPLLLSAGVDVSHRLDGHAEAETESKSSACLFCSRDISSDEDVEPCSLSVHNHCSHHPLLQASVSGSGSYLPRAL